MAKVTCIVNDRYPDTCNPLIYTVDVDDPKSLADIEDAVYEARREDLDFDENDELDLEFLLAFPGDLNPVADWRG